MPKVLQLLEDNVSLGLKECENLKNQKKDAKVEKKILYHPEYTKLQKIIIKQYSEMGLNTLFAVKEKRELCWGGMWTISRK